MFAPELLLLSGVMLMIGALVALRIAHAIRGWFFEPELRLDLRPVRGHNRHHR
jgi:hypothetical protein